ncbi:MAG: YbaK/EbsC family protein [Simkaniaceae bacterium]
MGSGVLNEKGMLPASMQTAQEAANAIGYSVAQLLGEKIEKADADFTRRVTGFAIGGIPPIGHKQKIRTLIDEDLLKNEVCWAAAGTPHAVFSIR